MKILLIHAIILPSMFHATFSHISRFTTWFEVRYIKIDRQEKFRHTHTCTRELLIS